MRIFVNVWKNVNKQGKLMAIEWDISQSYAHCLYLSISFHPLNIFDFVWTKVPLDDPKITRKFLINRWTSNTVSKPQYWTADRTFFDFFCSSIGKRCQFLVFHVKSIDLKLLHDFYVVRRQLSPVAYQRKSKNFRFTGAKIYCIRSVFTYVGAGSPSASQSIRSGLSNSFGAATW